MVGPANRVKQRCVRIESAARCRLKPSPQTVQEPDGSVVGVPFPAHIKINAEDKPAENMGVPNEPSMGHVNCGWPL